MNSNQKGKRGEREFRDLLRAWGYLKARRTQQYCGSSGDASDVICPELPGMHFEVKRCQRGNVREWLEQAKRDAKGKLPIVAHKRNHAPWDFYMPEQTLRELLKGSDLVDNDMKGMNEFGNSR